jgi:hypothetical protein
MPHFLCTTPPAMQYDNNRTHLALWRFIDENSTPLNASSQEAQLGSTEGMGWHPKQPKHY